MLRTKIRGGKNPLCAVAYSADEIMVRKSGKQYYGTEKTLARIEDDTLIIDKEVAKEYDISVTHINGPELYDKFYVVEIWDRELQSMGEFLSLSDAICMANSLLNVHLKDVDHGDEVEAKHNETSDWCRASAENLNAWCNYQGEWDAFIFPAANK